VSRRECQPELVRLAANCSPSFASCQTPRCSTLWTTLGQRSLPGMMFTDVCSSWIFPSIWKYNQSPGSGVWPPAPTATADCPRGTPSGKRSDLPPPVWSTQICQRPNTSCQRPVMRLNSLATICIQLQPSDSQWQKCVLNCNPMSVNCNHMYTFGCGAQGCESLR
jgi:hypothetical protein